MCYLLYGGINSEVSKEDLDKIENQSYINFSLVSKLQEDKKYFPRITNHICDCDTPLGTGDKKDKKLTQEEETELRNIAVYIQKLRKLRNIKHIWIQKLWYDDETERELTVHVDEIDLIPFLINIKEKNIYKIQLYKIYPENKYAKRSG